MRDKTGILSYIHCRRCVEAGLRPHIDAGLLSPNVLRVWCKIHKMVVVDFVLADPMPVRCDVCGEPITEGHVH